ncbi:hypothetical protein FUA23_01825 [Neolewinella aurantiaca]|uniref:Uncharacterized protein n=1 Tax=Neolewinella aurantiaca TaxID=2602767 RepID=A0A5C7FL81_9BACT|nr:hypothetical protein [Neolewinella aurantiaca]TXF91457.1 hypothetical protein FUA23_01825 [Neolewinella aurantiaca]
MPYYNYEISSDTLFIPASHILHLDLIVENRIYCEGKHIELIQLEDLVNNHLYRAIDKDTIFFVSLHSERAATYETYLAVKDVVLTQQKGRLNELSLQIFGEPYSSDMHVSRKRILRQQLELGLLEWTLNDSGPQLVETRNGLW